MKKFDSINVIPFIDIMLVLLAIVLATASFIKHGKIDVDVPQSASKTKVSADDIVNLITIDKQGNFFYKEAAVTIEELDKSLVTLNEDSHITIKIDAMTHFQKFVNVTDLLTKYHLKKVSVVTNTQSLSSDSSQPNAANESSGATSDNK